MTGNVNKPSHWQDVRGDTLNVQDKELCFLGELCKRFYFLQISKAKPTKYKGEPPTRQDWCVSSLWSKACGLEILGVAQMIKCKASSESRMRSEQTNGSNSRHQGQEKHHHWAPLGIGVRRSDMLCFLCRSEHRIYAAWKEQNPRVELPGWSCRTKQTQPPQSLWARLQNRSLGKTENKRMWGIYKREDQKVNGEPNKLGTNNRKETPHQYRV